MREKPALRVQRLAAYTFGHFCVDFACFFVLYRAFFPVMADARSQMSGALLYNAVAFALQPVAGWWCDRFERVPAGAIGCALVLAGLLFAFAPWPALVLCALGNAAFHVAGGRDSLSGARRRMSRSGVFVSTGALGIALGALAGRGDCPALLPALLVMGAGACAAAVELSKPRRVSPPAETGDRLASGRAFPMVLALCLTAVLLRSYVGAAVPAEWKSTVFFGLIPACCSALGKCAGGFAADAWGARRVGAASLLLAAALLAWPHPAANALGVLLFNIAMPITLCVTASLFPRNAGFAFGLTTLALFLGIVPAFFCLLPARLALWALPALCVCAAACLYVSTNKREAAEQHDVFSAA